MTHTLPRTLLTLWLAFALACGDDDPSTDAAVDAAADTAADTASDTAADTASDTAAGSEPEVVTGLIKPAGVLAVGDQLYISDQDMDQILVSSLETPADFRTFAMVERPDLICQGPDGSLFGGSVDGNFMQIHPDGSVEVLATASQEIRGVAYDPTHRRAFFADHDPDESDGVSHVLHIVPID